MEDGGNRVPSKGLRLSVESVDELIASDLKRAIAIFEERANQYPAEAFGVSWIVSEDLEVVAVEPVQPILSAKPHKSLIILEDLANFYLRQSFRCR